MPLPPNTKLGRYKVLSWLGAGGMGEVYLAHDSCLNRRVALKVLPVNLVNDRERLRRFKQEASAASGLNHPNIITIHEIGEDDATHFIAFEYIEGETLHSRLKGGAIRVSSVLEIAIQVACALDAAHQAGIVHRDIKPENVMIRPDGLIKVFDFGVAKLTERQLAAKSKLDEEATTESKQNGTAPGTLIGTASYMSPEQTRCQNVDRRTDIFSFGAMLYEMLSGKRPFVGDDVPDILDSIRNKTPIPVSQLLREVPRELERIIGKTLKKDREERYQTARDLFLDLKELKQDLELQIKLEHSAQPQSEAKKRHTGGLIGRIREKPNAEIRFGISRSRQFGLLVGSIILLMAIIVGLWIYNSHSTNSKPIESVAVMPFVNESGGNDIEYLSDGMTDTLISSLSQLKQLSVKPRSSVFRYKGKEVDAKTLGQELNVQAVLTGHVMQRGSDLSLHIELIDVRTDKLIWSENYYRQMTNLIPLQSEIALDVSNNLRTKLSGEDEHKVAKSYTANPKAYQLYLLGLFHWNKRTPTDLQKAIDYFEQAKSADLEYVLAYTGLADAYSVYSIYNGVPPHETMERAREAALRALSLDEQSAEAHTSLARILANYDFDLPGAARELKRAIELKPDYATAHEFYGELFTRRGRTEEAFAEFQRALEIEPFSRVINQYYGVSLFEARKYDESIAQLKRTIDLDANYSGAHLSLSIAYELSGNYAESVRERSRFQELFGNFETAALIRESYAQGGWRGYLRTMTGERRPTNWPSFFVAIDYATLGEKDMAFVELNKCYENREYYLVWLKVDPRLDPLREDPRFQELLRRVGLVS